MCMRSGGKAEAVRLAIRRRVFANGTKRLHRVVAPEEIISPQQAVPSERGSDQRSSARKANHRSLSSPAGRYLLVRSSRLRQENLGIRCLRIFEDVSGDWRACVARAFTIW